MQGPAQGLVQVAYEAAGTHQCAHAQHDVCPRNPDGPCTCAHTDPGDAKSDGPILRACHGGSDAQGPLPVPRWQSPGAPAGVPGPHVSAVALWSPTLPLPPQPPVDEILRPPRTAPPLRLS